MDSTGTRQGLKRKARGDKEGAMHRYLLFDSGCAQCTELAQAVAQATHGGLEARSLRDPAMQRLLAQARPY